MEDIIIRPFESVEDHDKAYALESEVWSQETAVPTNLTIAIHRHGGVVLGAFGPSGDLLGFVLGFTSLTHIPGARNGLSHHSHIAAVRPDLRGQGIGERLKRAQAEAVLAQGINLMTWTFDPLEARNAHFNLHKLGVICRTFIANCYGEMNDALNAGLPSDRFEAEWWLDQRIENDEWRMGNGEWGIPNLRSHRDFQSPISIEIPLDFQRIKKADLAEARRVRLALREQFEGAFAQSYAAVDFSLTDARAAYSLVQL